MERSNDFDPCVALIVIDLGMDIESCVNVEDVVIECDGLRSRAVFVSVTSVVAVIVLVPESSPE